MLTYDIGRSDTYHSQGVTGMLGKNVDIFVTFVFFEFKRYYFNLLVSFLQNKSKVGIPCKII